MVEFGMLDELNAPSQTSINVEARFENNCLARLLKDPGVATDGWFLPAVNRDAESETFWQGRNE